MRAVARMLARESTRREAGTSLRQRLGRGSGCAGVAGVNERWHAAGVGQSPPCRCGSGPTPPLAKSAIEMGAARHRWEAGMRAWM